MKTPKFWSSINPISAMLMPLSWIYYLGYRAKQKTTCSVTVPVPIICIGNLTAGGAGKTPVALYIGKLIKNKGKKAFFISRGYSGNIISPVLVDISKHTAQQVGDEPLLLAKILPTIVGKNRVAVAKFAISLGAEIIIMDDGFQNHTIKKDLSFIVVDRHLSFGNGLMLPAGPLREPVKHGLKRANAVIIINPATFLPTSLPNIPIIIARSQAKPSMLAMNGKKILAFCGIAYPNKFYTMLADCGADIFEKKSFPDHYHYTNTDLEKLYKIATEHSLQLVTTSKDATRLPEEFRNKVMVAEMELLFENSQVLEDLIEGVISAR